MIRRAHNKGHVWNHNKIQNQDGLINSLIKNKKSIDDVVNEFKILLPNYKGNYRNRVVSHINHLVKEHDDFPYDIIDGYFNIKSKQSNISSTNING